MIVYSLRAKSNLMLKFRHSEPSALPVTASVTHDQLGALCFSAAAVEQQTASSFEIPCAHIQMKPLDGVNTVWQNVYSLQDPSSVKSGQCGDVHFRHDDDILFGVVTLDEVQFAGDSGTPLQNASRHAYEQLFSAMQDTGFPYLLRCWNYLADINGISDGLERYRQFNLGRQQAFDSQSLLIDHAPPAACALGIQHDPRHSLTLAFLATRTAPIAVDNPRQVKPRDYPPEYGPRSPLFSRACIARRGDNTQLFLSGTASIAGHQTLHDDDVIAQTEETLLNIRTVLAAANAHCARPIALDDLEYTVYIRHAMHLLPIRDALEQRIGKNLKAAYLQADICRADLLLEIEGFVNR